MSKDKLTCASFFAGVGGIELGFSQAGFDIVYANEFDKCAATTYEANFSLKVDCRDINIVEPNEVPDFDLMIAGFPCQAFSVAGYRQGFDDEKGRGNLFFQLIRLIKAKRPKALFFENVKNLMTHDNGKTYKIIKESLHEEGYIVFEEVFNSCDYGNIPQNRERIYIVCFRQEDLEVIERFRFPERLPLTTTIRDFIDFENSVDKSYYYTDKFLHYDQLLESMKNPSTAYQWRRQYVRENKSNMIPTLTANMGMGGHNVPLIITDDGRFRKLTPKECFNIQGFPKNFVLPNTFAKSQLYKQAGNSVTVPVIKRIAEKMKKALV